MSYTAPEFDWEESLYMAQDESTPLSLQRKRDEYMYGMMSMQT